MRSELVICNTDTNKTLFKNTGETMDIKFRCMRCNSTHDEIEDAAHCCAYIQRIAECGKCGFKTLPSNLADNHKCEDAKND